MNSLSVIGNISRDRTRYPDDRGGEQLGGAALLVSLAAARAGTAAAPVAVVGRDLQDLPGAVIVDGLDWSALHVSEDSSTAFTLDYDAHGQLLAVDAQYGAPRAGTSHALDRIANHPGHVYHLCCRRPLDVAALLHALDSCSAQFSLDFFLTSAEQMMREAAPWLTKATTVFVNAAEHRLLAQVAAIADLAEVVVTDGPRPVRVYRWGRPAAEVYPPDPVYGEVTGAGDTLAGTYLAYRAQGATPEIALPAAAAAAAAHISAPPLPLPAPRRP
ncbi:carbohydrate kinase family protein [Streptomyces alboflavus]|uniref:carbohydrate kinase family protein n=1 Tax=Streptomyces alboflavus TaxID=67267 RepID=UPI0004BEF6E6|nr:carbohydrate kinase family protein [Streptomyces alboflavus]